MTNTGLLIQSAAAAWLMLRVTERADLVALVQTANSLPAMTFSILFAAVGARYRRSVLLRIQLDWRGASSSQAYLCWQQVRSENTASM